jgi:hypothetical protein
VTGEWESWCCQAQQPAVAKDHQTSEKAQGRRSCVLLSYTSGEGSCLGVVPSRVVVNSGKSFLKRGVFLVGGVPDF